MTNLEITTLAEKAYPKDLMKQVAFVKGFKAAKDMDAKMFKEIMDNVNEIRELIAWPNGRKNEDRDNNTGG